MNEHHAQHHPHPQPASDTGEEKAPHTIPIQESAEAQLLSQLARIVQLETQLAELKNENLRALADAENTRKRAMKEREETGKFAVSKLARSLLDVADNLNRALAAVKPEMLEEAGAAKAVIKNLFVGVEATERQLLAIFEQAGIQKIPSAGQPFDPNWHQVMVELESGDHPPGTVLQVLQEGYRIHDRLLREAMVGVAKAPAKAEAKTEAKLAESVVQPIHIDQKI